jgi:signal transduction histidine kinase
MHVRRQPRLAARRAIEVVVDQARDATSDRNWRRSPFSRLSSQCPRHCTRSGTAGCQRALCHIATEALRNALLHAQERRIEVEIRYHPREFRLRGRDDGRGIDPQILQGSRAGHFGIPGMRERARLVGGSPAFCSKPDCGTEIDLTVPASLAYAKELASPTLAAKIRRILSCARPRFIQP